MSNAISGFKIKLIRMKEDSKDKEIFPIKMKFIWLKKREKNSNKIDKRCVEDKLKGKWKEKLCKFQIKQNKVK